VTRDAHRAVVDQNTQKLTQCSSVTWRNQKTVDFMVDHFRNTTALGSDQRESGRGGLLEACGA
jgi:hypothetical protein